MGVPRFVAESSLYRTSRAWSAVASGGAASVVLPQLGACEALCAAQFFACLAASGPLGLLSIGCSVQFGVCLGACPPPPPPPCVYAGTCSGAFSDSCVNALCGACPAGQYNCLTKCSFSWLQFQEVCDIYCCTPAVSEPS